MDLKQKYGRTAMIAGASEGIGAAFAVYLAAEGMDLVLIARRLQPLQQLADSLGNRYKVNIICISSDLSEADAAKQIEEKLNGREINIMIYNAALSVIGPFVENSEDYLSQTARINMITPMMMVHSFGEKMLANERGAIILMASLAGLQGSGYLSVYAATKAFNRILAESLWYEWKESGVDIIACIAGATSTPGYINTHPEKITFLAPRVLDPAEVPDECFRKLGRQPSIITGKGNRIASFFMHRVLSVKRAVSIMGDTTRKMYRL